MNDEAGHSMLLHDLGNLALPMVDRILIEDIEKRIILCCSDRQLQDLADEIGHHGTAATALWIEMCCVGHGHVVGKLKRAVPGKIAIKRTGAKSLRAKRSTIMVNAMYPIEELCLAGKQPSVVIQIVNIHFETPRANAFNKRRTEWVSFLGDQLK